MSTGLNCEFVEFKPNQWYLILEQGNAPKNAFDWKDFADAYGPFPTEDAADKFLSRNFANPGGSYSMPYEAGHKWSETMVELIKNATSPSKFGGSGGLYGSGRWYGGRQEAKQSLPAVGSKWTKTVPGRSGSDTITILGVEPTDPNDRALAPGSWVSYRSTNNNKDTRMHSDLWQTGLTHKFLTPVQEARRVTLRQAARAIVAELIEQEVRDTPALIKVVKKDIERRYKAIDRLMDRQKQWIHAAPAENCNQ